MVSFVRVPDFRPSVRAYLVCLLVLMHHRSETRRHVFIYSDDGAPIPRMHERLVTRLFLPPQRLFERYARAVKWTRPSRRRRDADADDGDDERERTGE